MDEHFVNGVPVGHRAYELWRKSWYKSLPEVTISAFTETGQEESSITVPLQRTYTGRRPVIPSYLADTPCAALGTQDLLDHLNTALATSYTLDKPFLSDYLEACVKSKYDFGLIYGLLRRVWFTDDWSRVQEELARWNGEDQEERREALDGNRIVNLELQPRRVWDLYSNRVLPSWVMHTTVICGSISHAWVAEEDRTTVWTPINGHEWPVPIPKDVNLNLIRIELLNLGREYVWLDVLCLRQEGGWREGWRKKEWTLDVPTIGEVYAAKEVVVYLSGLGRPLTLKEGDLDSDRSWFRRAWTVQEVGWRRVIAGDTPDGPLHAEGKDGKYKTELLTRFHTQLQFGDQGDEKLSVSEVLLEMQKRVSTNPVDRIAGLPSLFLCPSIPAYYESATLEDAWTALVDSMRDYVRAELFFACPEPGDNRAKWRPSWDQAMTKPLLPVVADGCQFLHRDETGGVVVCQGWCIEGLVLGLAAVNGGHRRGELIVLCDGAMARFEITAPHTYPIPEDTYTLIYGSYCHPHLNVVGRRLPGEKFEKVSVVEISSEVQATLCGLHTFERREYILV